MAAATLSTPTRPSTASSAAASPAEDTAVRIVDAALSTIAQYGVTKSTLEDIARTAGCSRATLYRHFPGKQALIAAVVGHEIDRVGTVLDVAAGDTGDLEDLVVSLLHAVGSEFERHEALRTVLEVEPETVLTHITFDEGNRVLAMAAAIVAPHLARFMTADEAERAGEWLCRIAITYLFSPSEHVSLTDEDSVRRLVATYVRPGLDATLAGAPA